MEREQTASPNNSAYCQARKRLPLEEIKKLYRQLTAKIEKPGEGTLWHGRKVKVADGSSLSMPDTPQNQKRWPQPKSQKPGCGFPVMRIAALFSLATGVLLDLAQDQLAVHERLLFKRLWPHLQPGDVLLADRGFCSFADLYQLLQRGVDSVMRKHQARKNGRVIQRLGKNDRLVLWRKTALCPVWLTRNQWQDMPETLTVREIKVTVRIRGFRSKTIFLVTTLLDPVLYPTQAFADLYRQRWLAELFLRDIKTTLGMDLLRAKTPDLIEKELWIYLLAHNLVRALILKAAQNHQTPREKISFKGTLSTLRTWAPFLARPDLTALQRLRLSQLLLSYLARDQLPFRPNRGEPRAKKRRPKPYQLLTLPRRLFHETRHRAKYRKA